METVTIKGVNNKSYTFDPSRVVGGKYNGEWYLFEKDAVQANLQEGRFTGRVIGNDPMLMAMFGPSAD